MTPPISIPPSLRRLLGAAALALVAWALVIPPMQQPDEVAHYAYVERIVEAGELPTSGPAGDRRLFSTALATAMRLENLGVLIGNPAARPAFSELEADARRDAEAALGDEARRDGGASNPAAGNGPLYYLYEAPAYALGGLLGDSALDRQLLMRLANLPLLLGTVAFTWLLVAELTPRTWPPALAAGVVAVHPQLVSVTAGINPDAMLTLVWSAFLYATVVAVRRGLTRARLLAIILLALASALTHPRGYAVAVPAVVAVLLALRRDHAHARLARRLAWGLAGALVAVLVAVAVGGSSTPLVGRALVGSEGRFDLAELAAYLWRTYLPRLPFMEPGGLGSARDWSEPFVTLFWGAFASQEVRFPDVVYRVLEALTLVGLAGLAAAAWARRAALRPHLAVIALLATAVLAVLASVHLTEYAQLLAKPGNYIIVGRYLFPLIAVFGLAVAFALDALPARLRPWAGGALLAGVVALHLGGLLVTTARFYV